MIVHRGAICCGMLPQSRLAQPGCPCFTYFLSPAAGTRHPDPPPDVRVKRSQTMSRPRLAYITHIARGDSTASSAADMRRMRSTVSPAHRWGQAHWVAQLGALRMAALSLQTDHNFAMTCPLCLRDRNDLCNSHNKADEISTRQGCKAFLCFILFDHRSMALMSRFKPPAPSHVDAACTYSLIGMLEHTGKWSQECPRG